MWIAGDYFSSATAMFVFALMRYYSGNHGGFSSLPSFLSHPSVMLEQILFPLFIVAVSALTGCYQNLLHKSYLQEAANTFIISVISACVFFFAALVDDIHDDRFISYRLTLSLLGLFFGTIYLVRCALTAYTNKKIATGKWFYPTIIVGNIPKIEEISEHLSRNNSEMALKPIGYVALDGISKGNDIKLTEYSIDEAIDMANKGHADKFIMTGISHTSKADRDIQNRLLITGKDVLVPHSSLSPLVTRGRISNVKGIPLVNIGFATASATALNIKRCLDVAGAITGLVLSIPFMAIGAAAVAFDSKGPVIYRQLRVGRYGKQFHILKLRTMYDNAEPDGPSLSSPDDPRITRSGHWLRKYRIDELPQFWNIIRGDMSLVGPRPERSYFLEKLIEQLPEYALLQRVRPGLTSWGMVKFGYASSLDEIKHRAMIDLLYLDNMTLLTDIKIILYTIRTVITGKGI